MIKRAADYLVTQFKMLGLKVMRYDAFSTRSVYLKLDDGVVGTIRISDHGGKKHLRYKYNLIKNSNRYKRNDKGVERYFFPMRDIDLLIEKIMYDKSILMQKYGQNQYERYMKMNCERGKNHKGFWQQAKYM
ncbi:hypothetical protein [Rummeliibacillus suwonensis]|uniref:hypothetical protein n=1 Tax=Rummeliibacillus suwonensis TaxID=1306154 RepID=UPI00289C3C07|nr:hypothetical protein [Rummeliibacillus suwonensis]